jgi:undecaprenyl-diphosphatase
MVLLIPTSTPIANVNNGEGDANTGNWSVRLRSFRFFGLVAVFVTILVLVAFHKTDSFDLAAAKFFHDVGSAQLDGVMIALTLAGDLTTIFAVAVILAILRKTRRLGLAILVSLVVTSILLMYFKPVVARPLPPFEFHARIQLPDKFTLEQDVVGFTHVLYSFPSGHETLAVSLSFTLGFFLSRTEWRNHKGRMAANVIHAVWLYPILVGISRLYISAHYPSDLFASIALGVVISYVIVRVLRLDGESGSGISDNLFVKKKRKEEEVDK